MPKKPPAAKPDPIQETPATTPVQSQEAAEPQAPQSQAPQSQAADSHTPATTSAPSIDQVSDPAPLDDAAIEELLKQASFDDPNASAADSAATEDIAAGQAPPVTGEPFPLPNFQQVMADAQVSSIDLLRDVDLNVKIELGRSRMLVEDVLRLGEGSVVELDKLAGDPVDVFVNDRLVARGEVLVLNENFCVRVNEIVAAVKDEGR